MFMNRKNSSVLRNTKTLYLAVGLSIGRSSPARGVGAGVHHRPYHHGQVARMVGLRR
jgi:hypothetical protein